MIHRRHGLVADSKTVAPIPSVANLSFHTDSSSQLSGRRVRHRFLSWWTHDAKRAHHKSRVGQAPFERRPTIFKTLTNDGGPARRSAAGPTLRPDQPQKGAGHSDREGRRDSTCDENSMLKRAFRCRSGYKYEIEVGGILGWPVLCFLKSRLTNLITNELTAAQRQKSL